MIQSTTRQIELSIIIKTFNEEKNIGRCLEAIVNSDLGIPFEIIIADSASTDRTIEIASRFPVKIVQLSNPAERSCGIGPQLGYQYSVGKYIFILDADMLLHASFVKSALERMRGNSNCGGIGGHLVERSGLGYEYERRNAANIPQEEAVNWLDGAGLYRREAIASVGYLTNRNLHAYEEKELGLRLRSAGWHLCRIRDVAVDHYGHSINSLQLLWRRWRSGYAAACGESIRACIGKPYLSEMLSVHKAPIVCLAFQILAVASIALLPWSVAPLLLFAALLASGLIIQTVRKNGFRAATLSLLYTNVFAIGVAKGLMTPQRNPEDVIESCVLKSQENRNSGHTEAVKS
jgi:GT2 family glycosyltransferase